MNGQLSLADRIDDFDLVRSGRDAAPLEAGDAESLLSAVVEAHFGRGAIAVDPRASAELMDQRDVQAVRLQRGCGGKSAWREIDAGGNLALLAGETKSMRTGRDGVAREFTFANQAERLLVKPRFAAFGVGINSKRRGDRQQGQVESYGRTGLGFEGGRGGPVSIQLSEYVIRTGREVKLEVRWAALFPVDLDHRSKRRRANLNVNRRGRHYRLMHHAIHSRGQQKENRSSHTKVARQVLILAERKERSGDFLGRLRRLSQHDRRLSGRLDGWFYGRLVRRRFGGLHFAIRGRCIERHPEE